MIISVYQLGKMTYRYAILSRQCMMSLFRSKFWRGKRITVHFFFSCLGNLCCGRYQDSLQRLHLQRHTVCVCGYLRYFFLTGIRVFLLSLLLVSLTSCLDSVVVFWLVLGKQQMTSLHHFASFDLMKGTPLNCIDLCNNVWTASLSGFETRVLFLFPLSFEITSLKLSGKY